VSDFVSGGIGLRKTVLGTRQSCKNWIFSTQYEAGFNYMALSHLHGLRTAVLSFPTESQHPPPAPSSASLGKRCWINMSFDDGPENTPVSCTSIPLPLTYVNEREQLTCAPTRDLGLGPLRAHGNESICAFGATDQTK
jgi:hypothetical protein